MRCWHPMNNSSCRRLKRSLLVISLSGLVVAQLPGCGGNGSKGGSGSGGSSQRNSGGHTGSGGSTVTGGSQGSGGASASGGILGSGGVVGSGGASAPAGRPQRAARPARVVRPPPGARPARAAPRTPTPAPRRVMFPKATSTSSPWCSRAKPTPRISRPKTLRTWSEAPSPKRAGSTSSRPVRPWSSSRTWSRPTRTTTGGRPRI